MVGSAKTDKLIAVRFGRGWTQRGLAATCLRWLLPAGWGRRFRLPTASCDGHTPIGRRNRLPHPAGRIAQRVRDLVLRMDTHRKRFVLGGLCAALVLLCCLPAAAEPTMSLEDAAARKPPEFTPLYEDRSVVVSGQVSSKAIRLTNYLHLAIQ